MQFCKLAKLPIKFGQAGDIQTILQMQQMKL